MRVAKIARTATFQVCGSYCQIVLPVSGSIAANVPSDVAV